LVIVDNETRLEIRRSTQNGDGWCVALDGTDVVGFFGPDARVRAEHHKVELASLLSACVPPYDRDEPDQ
jgi:hypothetical protein